MNDKKILVLITEELHKLVARSKTVRQFPYAVNAKRMLDLFKFANKEIVICAAVKTKSGKVFRGHRHSDAIKAAHEEGWTYEDLSFADQGFVTSQNRYVNREEGRKLQDASGIPSADKEGYRGTTLFSEDLY